MLQPPAPFRRNPAGRAGRIGLAVLVAALGYGAFTFSLAQAVSGGDPELAHRLAPYDGRLTARLAASLAGADATTADRARSDALARTALRQDPTAVVAVSTLGINAQVRNDTPDARRLFAYAKTLSRRDLITQLWLIEDAVGRGDITAALGEYDITLRTKPAMSDTLFPVLAGASRETPIRAALVRTLAGKPPWGEQYVTYVAATGRDPDATAALFTDLARSGVAVPATARANVVNALLSASAYDAAWSYYASVHPGADRRHLRDARFAGTPAPSQLDWTAIDDGGIIVTIEGGSVDFAAPPSVGGPALRQAQVLPPGHYRLDGRSEGIEQAADALPYWTLTCLGGRELGRTVVPSSAKSGGRFVGEFIVPPACPMQTLTLTVQPSDGMAGATGRIVQVDLAPAA